ncbi:distal tail protein Dit [Klebsiella pneumoniae]
MLVGRKRPSWAPVKRRLVRVPHRAGALLLNTETEERRIDVPLVIKAKKDMADLQKLKEDLADWLYIQSNLLNLFLMMSRQDLFIIN